MYFKPQLHTRPRRVTSEARPRPRPPPPRHTHRRGRGTEQSVRCRRVHVTADRSVTGARGAGTPTPCRCGGPMTHDGSRRVTASGRARRSRGSAPACGNKAPSSEETGLGDRGPATAGAGGPRETAALCGEVARPPPCPPPWKSRTWEGRSVTRMQHGADGTERDAGDQVVRERRVLWQAWKEFNTRRRWSRTFVRGGATPRRQRVPPSEAEPGKGARKGCEGPWAGRECGFCVVL